MPATKTDEYLASIFADSFKREIDGDEAIWRSLPFFAAIIGLAVAVLPSVFHSGANLAGTWRFIFLGLFGVCILAFGWAGFWFSQVVRLRRYNYPPNDMALLAYANSLREFYLEQKLPDAEADERVRDEMRQFMIRELARSATVNRRNNNAKSVARSQVLLFAMLGFLFAFLSEGTILLSQALVRPAQVGKSDDTGISSGETRQARDRAGRAASQAGAASGRDRLGGG